MSEDLYRPAVHFSVSENWMNDPNGMVYFDGKYHLFYQFHPYSTVWGPMHWGHAVSEDLINWDHRPSALAPDELGCIWSGSAVYDELNTSGLGEDGKGPLVAIFTYHSDERERHGLGDHQYQGLAFSNDAGDTWHKYADNPVLPNLNGDWDFRDPKVLWHADSKRWVMILAVGDEAQIWTSPNLRDWRYASSFGAGVGAHSGVWECPDLVELPIEGQDRRRWVWIQSLNPGGPHRGSGTQYFVGDFDGERFIEDVASSSNIAWIDDGPDCYAGVTWSNIPVEDGRTIFLGWLGNWEYATQVPTGHWRGMMTIPRSLTLRQTAGGLRLCSQPVRELQLKPGIGAETQQQMIPVDEAHVLMAGDSIAPADVSVGADVSPARGLELRLSNDAGDCCLLGYDASREAFFFDRVNAGVSDFSPRQFPRRYWVKQPAGRLDLRMIVDRCSIEVFLSHGERAFTAQVFPSKPYTKLEAIARESALLVEWRNCRLA